MAALAVEPLFVYITTTSTVTVKETLFLVPNSLLSFNLEGNGFMSILQASYSLNGISTPSWQKKGSQYDFEELADHLHDPYPYTC